MVGRARLASRAKLELSGYQSAKIATHQTQINPSLIRRRKFFTSFEAKLIEGRHYQFDDLEEDEVDEICDKLLLHLENLINESGKNKKRKLRPAELVIKNNNTVENVSESPTDDATYTSWLGFVGNTELRRSYREDFNNFKRSDSNDLLNSFVVVIYFITLVSFYTIYYNHSRISEIYIVSITTASIWFLATLLLIFLRLALTSYKYDIEFMQPYHIAAKSFSNSAFGTFFDDTVLVTFQLSVSLLLLDWGMNNLESLDCMPVDLMVMSMSSPLLIQLLTNCVSRHALVMSWVINILVMNIQQSYHAGPKYLTLNAIYVMLLVVSYEFERSSIRHFVKSIAAVAVTELNAELLLEVAAQRLNENEKALNAKRRYQSSFKLFSCRVFLYRILLIICLSHFRNVY